MAVLPTWLFAERIIVIGDSITGHSMNLANGYKYQFDAALDAVGVSGVSLIPLGGSGQQTTTWLDILDDARTSFSLDIASIDVPTELNAGCDKLVIALGANDLLFQGVRADNPDAFVTRLQNLIDKLRQRTSFTKLYICTPPMMNEDSGSYWNTLLDTLAANQIPEVAGQNDATVIDVRGEFKKWWRIGRCGGDGFRITGDYIHPNDKGHFAIVLALLKGLGYGEAAAAYETFGAETYFGAAAAQAPGFSACIRQKTGRLTFDGFSNADLKAVRIVGWTDWMPVSGRTFTLSSAMKWFAAGSNIRLEAEFSDGAKVLRSFRVGAPWKVATGIDGYSAHDNYSYHHPVNGFHTDAEADHYLEFDRQITGKTPFDEIFPSAQHYWPNADHFGDGEYGSLDFTAITAATRLETCYAMRKLAVPEATRATLTLKCTAQSGAQRIVAFLDSEEVLAASLNVGQSSSAELSLSAGLHELVVKAVQAANCFQAEVALSPSFGEDAIEISGGEEGAMLCQGGDAIFSRDGYNIHRFTSDGTLTVLKGGTAELLLVGGGAGGGGNGGCSGGGGAGGVVHLASFALPAGSYPVTIGVGGGSSQNGGDTMFVGVTAVGGGTAGTIGGSGGGANGYPNSNVFQPGAAGTSGQGTSGGNSPKFDGNTNNYFPAGGGGGAGSAGGDATAANQSGVGGAGVSFTQFTVDGSSEWFAAGGGGGGSSNKSINGGSGGQGGGGAGAKTAGSVGGDASTPGSGGGAGSFGYFDGNWQNAAGGKGADGILVVRYRAAPESETMTATGGDEIVKDGEYMIHVFTNNGTFASDKLGEIEILVVGGGGAGGGSIGGGGGAGGVLYSSAYVMTEREVQVVVGAGGVGANGEDSSFGRLVAKGGGLGGRGGPGASGGSGGGGAGLSNAIGTRLGGNSVTGQGNSGGSGDVNPSAIYAAGGGGGGGAGGAGENYALGGQSGAGGVGRYFEHFAKWGDEGWFGGGGGGGARPGAMSPGAGGKGGGAGGRSVGGVGNDGMDHTGGGGSGGTFAYVDGTWTDFAGGSGGSGIVIIRYRRPKKGALLFLR